MFIFIFLFICKAFQVNLKKIKNLYFIKTFICSSLSIFDKLLIPLLSTIIDAPSESNIAEINLEELSNYLSLLTSQNEDDFRVHDQIVFNLIERINFELKLKTLKRFDKLVFFLMNFYNKSVHNRKNGDKVIKIYELVQLILVCLYMTSVYLKKF